MTVQLRAESLKLRSVPLPRLMLILAALGAGFISFVVVHTANAAHTTVSPTNLVTAVAAPLWFLAVVVAVVASAGTTSSMSYWRPSLISPRSPTTRAPRTSANINILLAR
jgi:hypothetical protein